MPANGIYSYETPRWAVIFLCVVSIAISLLCFTGFYGYRMWASEAPTLLKWLILLIGMGFLIVAIRPRNWRPWRYFVADAQGIRFPSECPETENTQWLLVPWQRIGNISKEVFYDRFKGPSIALILSDEEIETFFRDIKLKKKFFNRQADEGGYFKVGYSNAFIRADKAVKILSEYKAHADKAHGH